MSFEKKIVFKAISVESAREKDIAKPALKKADY